MTEGSLPAPAVPEVSRWNLFSGFVLIGMFGFGGIAAATLHVAVDRRRWVTAAEYTSLLGLVQVLPGAALINMATMLGDRFQGATGSLLALAGLLTTPLLTLLGLVALYDRFSYLPDVKAATAAAAAGAVGLTLGTGIKLARNILRSPWKIGLSAVSFVSIGLLHIPLVTTILVLAPVAFGMEFWKQLR